MKKFFAIFLCLVFVFSFSVCIVHAEESTENVYTQTETTKTEKTGVVNVIKFPNLGLEFEVSETAFHDVFGIESLDIQWYGVIIATGIVLAFLMFYYLGTKKELIDGDSIYNITLIVVPIAIIGARVAYVVTSWEHFKGKGFLNMINIRNGGIAIYGAIIFGLVTVLIYNKFKKTSPLSMLDALVPAVMLGQAIGRWGNFVNAEAYGWSEGVENLPWAMWLERVYVDGAYRSDIHFVHPTFLYESLWNILGLAIILIFLYRKKKFDGEILFAYLGWYGLGRAFIETIRADSLYVVGTLKFSVMIGVICVIAAVIGEIVLYRRHKEEESELAEYKSSYTSIKIALENEGDALAQRNFETETNIDTDIESDIEEPSNIDETDDIESLDELEDINDADIETLAEQDILDGEPTETQTEE